MTALVRGRVAPSPPPPFSTDSREPFVGVHAWNAPKSAIGKERPLTREQHAQGQAVLRNIQSLPHFLSLIFLGRHTYLLKEQGIHAANKWLVLQFQRRIWPRIEIVNDKNAMRLCSSPCFMAEVDNYASLPGMDDKGLRRFADRIAGQLLQNYDRYCEEFIAENNGDNSQLISDSVQAEFYGRIAHMARAFNVTPMHWRKYLKDKLDATSAIRSLQRLVNSEWWERQLKAQRTRWREALLIAAGEVNLKKHPYASKQAIREVQARRLANMDYLKGCELENVATGERVDLIDKVMASISNPEIRRKELMSTIAGIEKYAASEKHVGMFITITTPSKYHPTRVVGKEGAEKVQFNHNWDLESFSPKDGQRYLVHIWSKMRTAFKDNDLSVYGMRVVEPHHDGTPHWHMMLFCQRKQRQDVIDIMRRYALKEDGDERGAAKNRFEAKHMNKGGAAGYIAKYIAKNIDGYALDGQIDHDTGKPLRDMAAAVTSWASTWRIPQFKTIGIPTMGAYRECRAACLRHISLADSFDERVEAVREAASAGNFAAYMAGQGGANVPRDVQTVRVARKVADEPNAYDEEVQKVVGIFAPHLGAGHIHETRSTEWRIVRKAVDVDVDVDVNPLTLKSASGAPRSPVNNCGEVQREPEPDMQVATPEYVTAVMNLIESGDVSWNDTDVAKTLRGAIRGQSPKANHQDIVRNRRKSQNDAPSARLTPADRARIPQIRLELSQHGITAERWELKALTRGATIIFGDQPFSYPMKDEWPGWST
ncbi:replication protein [Serratia sp. OLHL2]|uniref:replication endonuclease n=1 Tax=unclassified Serratia (in: enterobacteria) TaxID=2647522 RepID=UPI000C173CF4|nr:MULTISPECIES: replication endonuclease [unclassified Serratia (in: enterobacteria)]PII53335.1 replication protein [Serratia sp. OLEL1]PII57047.1 replication protein [Serratia sp. OLCL1]PII63477.1 replication protein [Serratia sp. OLHL2]PII64330.1 replication protein [Serratia sp. OLBL1]PII71817.1 replication protein [Serratia sp. OLDL1]